MGQPNASRSLDAEDAHKPLEPARVKRRLLRGVDAQRGYGGEADETSGNTRMECGSRRVDGDGREVGPSCCETWDGRRLVKV